MNLTYPISSVIPSAHGAVLGVLARTTEPLSGRRIAALTRPRVSQSRVNSVLGQLARDGIAEVESRPPASYYKLNREHVAAPGVLALASMWQALLDHLRTALDQWPSAPTAAWLFGSTAPAEAGSDSDLDLLLIRPDKLPSEDLWQQHVDELASQVRLWSGNSCEPLVLTETELQAAIRRDDRIVQELRRDAIHLVGARPSTLLGKVAR